MGPDKADLVKRISDVAPMLHTAGPISPKIINAIYRRIRDRNIQLSVETGCGASTLLLSHFSGKHLVFAEDRGSGSITNTRRSPLLNRSTVEFIEGPTQKTLPHFRFTDAFEFALIDGPHAYPFPDLEYYYIYPNLSSGALLVLDDIQIRTIHNLLSFLRRDTMFHLDEVVGATAFLTRTNAPAFCPTGDNWQLQAYNKKSLRRYDWTRQAREVLPARVRRVIKSTLRGWRTDCKVCIDRPEDGSVVGETGLVAGRAEGNLSDRFLWVLVRREDQSAWWPQGGGPVPVTDGRWQCAVEYGGPEGPTSWFEILAVLANSSITSYLLHWGESAAENICAPIHGFPFRPASVADAYRRVKRHRT
jgi:Methyltransferase domain